MKILILKNKEKVLLDDKDFIKASKHKWFLGSGGYPVGTPYNRKQQVYLHRFILNPPVGMVVDHINHNKLDNRKENLKICTQSENCKNTVIKRSNNTSGYRGVSWIKWLNKWRAYIYRNKKQIHLGVFNTFEEALSVRKFSE